MAYIRIALDRAAIERACEYYLRKEALQGGYREEEKDITAELIVTKDANGNAEVEVLCGFDPEQKVKKAE